MASTSLAAQLKKLETPQTSLLFHKKTKPSFLFDGKQASRLDRDSVYDIGLSGLEELKKLNSNFDAFDGSLFDVSSRNFERAVETSEANEKINFQVRTFLSLLSPYFLLKPAHKCLEWLIHRYHIQKFNVDDVMFLILPYHETMLFARMIQILQIEENTGKWHWLFQVQKKGVPLSKSALLNRAANDMSFLKFVCDMPEAAIKVNGIKATSLTTLYAFYCTTLIGALEHAKAINELHVTHILPSIMSALSSSIPDFTASGFMIVARLATKANLSEKIREALCSKISKVDHSKLRSETCLVLVLLCQNTSQEKIILTEKVAIRLSQAPWFAPSLAVLSKKQIHVLPMVLALLRAGLRLILREEENNDMQEFVEKIVNGIYIDNADAHEIFTCLLEEFNESASETTIGWYSRLFKQMETSFPQVFDTIASAALKNKESKERTVIEQLLGFNTSRNDLYQRLVHPNPSIRAEAVNHIVKHYAPDQLGWLRQTLLSRFEDESPEVILALFQLPRAIMDLFARDALFSNLVSVIARFTSVKHSKLLKQSVKLLSDLIDSEEQNTIVAILLLPSIFTVGLNLLDDASENCNFLSKLKTIKNSEKGLWKYFTEANGQVPSPDCLVEAFKSSETLQRYPKFWVSTAFLLSSSLGRETNSEKIKKAINFLVDYLSFPKIRADSESLQPLDQSRLKYSFERTNKLMIDGALDCLTKVVVPADLTKSPKKLSRWFHFINEKESLSFQIYRVIYQGHQSKIKAVENAFHQTEAEFLKTHFKDSEERLNFVLSFALYDKTYECHSVSTALRMLKDDSSLILTALKRNSIVVPSLVILLASQNQSVRSLVMDIVLTLAVSDGFYRPFLDALISMSEQMILDPEQITLAAFTKLSPGKEIQGLMLSTERKSMSATLVSICEHVTSSDTPLNVKANLLKVLELVQSEELFHKFQPLALEIIGRARTLSESEFSILNSVLQRFNASFVSCLKEESSWTFLDKVLADQKTTLSGVGDAKKPCPASILLQQITKELIESVPEPKAKNQERLLSLIIKHLTDSESVSAMSAAVNVFKRITIDCKILVAVLTPMLTVEASLPPEVMRLRPQTRSKVAIPPSLEILQSPEWKQGTYVLEMIQNKKKLVSVGELLPCLFSILKKCLKFEHQAPVEYTKQLLLTTILHACEKLSVDKSALSEDILEADLVVDCIRGSQNPQTHHHALLTLTHLACLIPDKVLHNIMAIFTFIGSSVLRQDDAYSFQIICKIVDSIIPVLIKKPKAESEVAVAGVLRVFVSALVDVPEHRRLPLFKKILAILDESQYLWLFLCLVFESHVLCSNSADVEVTTDYPEISLAPKRLDICLQMCDDYPPEVILKTACHFLKHLNSLPLEKDEVSDELKDKLILAIFNIKRNTAKQFRHYKYTLLTFLSTLLSSTQFVQKMSELTEEDSSLLKEIFSSLVEESLLFIRIVLKQVEYSSGQNTAKYWRIMLNQSYDILDKANALLPTDLFLAVIKNLLDNDLEAIRRKSMELLGWRLLQPRPVPVEALLDLLPPLIRVLNSLDEENAVSGVKEDAVSQDAQLTQQTALFALKLMVRHLASTNIEKFKRVLVKVTDVIGWENPVNWPVLGSLVLCLGELVSALKAQSLFQLSKFMPSLLRLLSNFKMDEGGDLFLQSIVTALLKIVDCLVHFLSPYLPKILFEVSLLSSKYTTDLDKAQPLAQKLKAIRTKLSTDLPNRVLVPSARNCFSHLIKKRHFHATAPLMAVLADNFKSGSDLTVELTDFFLEALQFRQAHASLPLPTVNIVEDAVINCFSSLVLKLSESGFRPLYYKLYDWSLRSVENRERSITFFRLSVKIAESLKNLFNLFAGIFVNEVSELLNANNTMKNCDFFDNETEKSCLLVESILRTLYTVFTFDAHNFLTKERFNTLMQPLVDQLENQVGGVEIWKQRTDELVVPCLAQMARSIVDDSLWKQLNYSILLKSRSDNKYVRLSSARTVCALASKLGEDFLPLLPESVPFLAELLEDEEEDVENECRRIVLEMEKVLGEPIQKYF